MSPLARRALTLSVLTAALSIALVADLHREILRVVWPLLESFWFTYIAF